MHWNNSKEGLKKIQHLYLKNSSTTGGEFADYLAKHYKEEFSNTLGLPTIMEAIQLFREWDYEGEGEVQAEIEMQWVKDPDFKVEGGYWDNDFMDYMFEDGSFVPQGMRVGIILNNKLVLDEGILFSNNARRGEKGDE